MTTLAIAALALVGLTLWVELRRPPKRRCAICGTPLFDNIPTCDECRWNRRGEAA